jgi:hypothetical protein
MNTFVPDRRPQQDDEFVAHRAIGVFERTKLLRSPSRTRKLYSVSRFCIASFVNLKTGRERWHKVASIPSSVGLSE